MVSRRSCLTLHPWQHGEMVLEMTRSLVENKIEGNSKLLIGMVERELDVYILIMEF
jgi:hypothetical protein